MANLRKTEILKRLGFAPEQLEFRGQCYDTGVGNELVCALTQRPIRFCFTLKPRVGKGKVTVGPASFHLIKWVNPDLYLQLEAGRLFLLLGVEAENRDLHKASLRKRLSDTQQKLGRLRLEANQRIQHFRVANRSWALPENLALLKSMLSSKKPEFHEHDQEMRWYEQAIVKLESELLKAPQVGEAPVAVAPVVAINRAFKPIIEIEF